MIMVRKESLEDIDDVHRINELAFGRPNEAALVDALRKNAYPYVSLVAVKQNQMVGHIFFTPVSIESDHTKFVALALAPMAVLPEFQRRGIGTLLVREGLKEYLRIGHPVVVVLGHSDYYPRFGFVPAKSKRILCGYPVPDEVFMVVELTPGALCGRKGLVKYRPEFEKV